MATLLIARQRNRHSKPHGKQPNNMADRMDVVPQHKDDFFQFFPKANRDISLAKVRAGMRDFNGTDFLITQE